MAIEAADSLFWCHFDLGKTVVSPVCTPRVLDKPVGLVYVNVIATATVIIITSGAVGVPFCVGAVLYGRVRVSLSVIVAVRICIPAYGNHAVVHFGIWALSSCDYTLFVEHESIARGINMDSDWLVLDGLFDRINIIWVGSCPIGDTVSLRMGSNSMVTLALFIL